ncbi:hypothetical protein [Actinospica robiniae]|uniref:competence protein CoiA family protein n=1 Tax=Actinospica robiniae TaxID=304901 RepID=UPI00040FD988|nr:hypothetical protein [Actinospica robiniae]
MTHTVRHTGYDIVLNLTLPDLGHPQYPGLWEEIYRPRRFDRSLLRCTWTTNGVTCPGAMYVQVRDGARVAVHCDTKIAAHPLAAPESDVHKALKERVARSAQQGGFDAEVEESASDRARVTDVLVTGTGGRRVGWEIQLSGIAPRRVVERSNLARSDGITPLWAVDKPTASPINRAPWARMDEITDWRIAAGRALFIRGGVRSLRMRPCEPAWFERCPAHAALPKRFCDGKHPRLEPKEIHLEDLVVGSACAQFVSLFVPARKKTAGGWFFWLTAPEKQEFLQGSPEAQPYGFHYGEPSTIGRVHVPRDRDSALDATAWRAAPPSTDFATGRLLPPVPPVEAWQYAEVGDPAPCIVCGRPAHLRHPGTGQPAHKVCFC